MNVGSSVFYQEYLRCITELFACRGRTMQSRGAAIHPRKTPGGEIGVFMESRSPSLAANFNGAILPKHDMHLRR